MHFAQLTAPEQRVLGCLIEKRWTTPEQYPLSLNALRLACNQSTNRDPVTEYDENTVRDAAQRLSRYGLTRLASGHNSRAIKYRHLAEEGLGLGREQLAVLGVLLLRGPQTPGECKMRSERMAPLSLTDVERVLGELGERGYVRRIPRRPGQKEDRFEHLLGGDDGDGAPAATQEPAAVGAPPVPITVRDDLEQRVATLEAEVGDLRKQLTRLTRPALRFEDAAVDNGPGGELAQAMREEIAQMYDDLELDGPAMPKAGPAELGPPGGLFIVGRLEGRAVCCGGVKRLDELTCEIKKMYVSPDARGKGVARDLLHELEDRARAAGYRVARLDTGPRQSNARGLYEAEGYAAIENFNANPVANFWGEKPLV